MINSNGISFSTVVVTVTGIDLDISTKFNSDRYVGDILTLPYTFNEIRIKSNELGIADNINASLSKLYHNFLYINSNTRIADNNFPNNYKGFMASTSATSYSGVGWYPALSGHTNIMEQLAASHESTTRSDFSGVVAGDFIKPSYSSSEYFGVVALSGTLLGIRSSVSDTTPPYGDNIVLNKTSIEDASGLTFTDIRAIRFNSQNRAIIVDNTSVYKMDLDPVLTSNRALSSIGQFLIKSIGGKSRNIYDKDKFNKPIDVAIGNNDTVYILDQDDYGIKKYDSNLNWVQTSARKSQYTSLSGGKVVSIAVDKHTDYVYVLSDNGIIFEYDSALKHVQTITLTDPTTTTENFSEIVFSNKESNVVYVMTTESVYKKFKSRLDKSIGAFRLSDNNISGETLTFCSIMQTADTSYDYLFVGSNQAGIGKIFKFDESIAYKTVSNDKYKTDLLHLSSIKVSNTEYAADLSINKALNKMMFNHLKFRDSFHMKYTAAYDVMGRIQLTGIDYLKDTDYSLDTYTISQDMYVGINEPFFADNVNKSLKKIYDLQINLLKMCTETITNKHPYATQVIELK